MRRSGLELIGLLTLIVAVAVGLYITATQQPDPNKGYCYGKRC
jgi:hypothetical protein